MEIKLTLFEVAPLTISTFYFQRQLKFHVFFLLLFCWYIWIYGIFLSMAIYFVYFWITNVPSFSPIPNRVEEWKERNKKKTKCATKINKKRLCTILSASLNSSAFFSVIYRRYKYTNLYRAHKQTHASYVLIFPLYRTKNRRRNTSRLVMWWIS